MVGFPRLRLFDHRQTVFPTQCIRRLPHGFIILAGTVIFAAIYEGNRVQDEVVMQMIGVIQMRSNDHLIAVSPKPLRQLHADFVGDLRRSLARREALIPVIGHGAILFAVLLLYSQHFLAGSAGKAVDARHKTL